MKKEHIIIPIVMLAMLIALSIPTSALEHPVALGYNKIVDSVPHGDFTVKWINSPSPFTFPVPDKELYWVGIYDSVWMPGDPIHETYNGHTLPDSSPFTSNNTRLTGCGTCGVWFDNETGNTTQGASNTYHSWNVNNAHGTGVPIVYIEPDNPNTLYYWFYQGYDDSEGYGPCPGYGYCMDYTFHNVTASVATKWTLMVAVTCAESGNVTFNGNALPNGYDVYSSYYDVAINDVTGMVNDEDNTVGLRTDEMYFHPYWMWLVGETVAGAPPVAGFTANVATGPAPLAVHFTDTSSGEIASRNWDSDNNGEVDSTDQHPDYTYTDPGVYTVRLNVTGPGGSDEEIKVDYITVTERIPSTPFMIYGWVNDTEGALLNDPDVNVTNLNTSEIYDVETNVSFNYYQVITHSDNVSAGDVLHFTAIAETTTEFDHEVTAADMNRGGFVQNITIEAIAYPDMVITAINAYHYSTNSDAWFNLTNEIDVTVENIGDVNVPETFNVSLSIEGVPFGKLSVSQLNISESKTVTFEGWTPIGEDCLKPVCQFDWSSEDYNFTAVADCGNDVEERDEENNEITVVDMACYNGYMADEPLESVAHGVLHGGVLFTTGDGEYESLSAVGSYSDTNYEIELPVGASVELAHLNVYYTWNEPLGTCPEMEVNITIPGGTTYTALPLMEAYNDIKCECEGSQYVLPWGNYVYNLTNYITENGTYTVRVKNNCTACETFCPAAPGIVLVYEDANASQIEYWINEGADVLIGGRRPDGGYLAWWGCINNATFPASTGTGGVANATLGVVTPWGDSVTDDILFFNEIELGRGVYSGYMNTVDETLNGMSMYIGSTYAQVGVNMTDVKAQYAHESENMVSQAGDGDNMMPANAFLVVERMEKKDDVANADISVKGTVSGSYVDTQVSDDVYESITEKPGGYSSMEHKWTIDVTGGSSVTFYLEGHRTANTEGDDFVFAYSIDNNMYTNMVTVSKNADDGSYQTCGLPSDISGTVYIRVMDTDRTAGNRVLDTIHIDHMFIRSVFGAPDTTAPAAVTDLAASGPTSSSIMLTWTAPGDDGNTGTANSYDIRYSTATITDANWGSAAQCTEEPSPQPAGSSETFTVTGLDANTTYYFALKTSDEVPNESPLSNVASNTTKEASANTMHIASIDMSTTRYQDKGWYTYATATVTVVNSTGEPVGSATVEGHWSGLTSDTDSGPTGSDGKVAVNSNSVKNAAGTFTFRVDNVDKEGWTYNSTANVETQDSISV